MKQRWIGESEDECTSYYFLTEEGHFERRMYTGDTVYERIIDTTDGLVIESIINGKIHRSEIDYAAASTLVAAVNLMRPKIVAKEKYYELKEVTDE